MIYGIGTYQGIAQDWIVARLGIAPKNDLGDYFWGTPKEMRSSQRLLAFDYYRGDITSIAHSLRDWFEFDCLNIMLCSRLNPLLIKFRDEIRSDPKFFEQLSWDVFDRILLPNPQKIDIFQMTKEQIPPGYEYIPLKLQNVQFMDWEEIDQIKKSGSINDKMLAIDSRIQNTKNPLRRKELCRLVLVAHNFHNFTE